MSTRASVGRFPRFRRAWNNSKSTVFSAFAMLLIEKRYFQKMDSFFRCFIRLLRTKALMTTWISVCVLSAGVFLGLDIASEGGFHAHIYFRDSEDYRLYGCGLCTSASKYCCPVELRGCNMSTMFCSWKSEINECEHVRPCYTAWTYKDIAGFAILSIPIIPIIALTVLPAPHDLST